MSVSQSCKTKYQNIAQADQSLGVYAGTDDRYHATRSGDLDVTDQFRDEW